MGRKAKGQWALHQHRSGYYYVRFTLPGRSRVDESTRERDRSRAEARAREIYAREVAGVERPRSVAGANLEEAAASWLAEAEGGLDPLTVKQYGRWINRWVLAFESVSEIANANKLTTYAFSRLKQVLRCTLQGELSAISGLLQWCKRNSLIAEVPKMPEIPVKKTGTRSGKQRAKPVELTQDQIRQLLAELPVLSSHRGPDVEPTDEAAIARLWELHATGASHREVALVLTEEGFTRPRGGPWHHQQVQRIVRGPKEYQRYPVRAYFEFAYETGLRPETLVSIKVPTNWQPGAAYLEIEDAIDKARFGRKVPLSERARELLVEHAPGSGQIWGRHNYWRFLKPAAARLGLSAQVAPYDLRHARATHWLEATGNLPGVAFLLGHKRITTTNRYAHANRAAAEAVINSG